MWMNLSPNTSLTCLFLFTDVDEPLSKHIAHLFIRDPISLFSEKLHQDDEQDTDHFEVWVNFISATIWLNLLSVVHSLFCWIICIVSDIVRKHKIHTSKSLLTQLYSHKIMNTTILTNCTPYEMRFEQPLWPQSSFLGLLLKKSNRLAAFILLAAAAPGYTCWFLQWIFICAAFFFHWMCVSSVSSLLSQSSWEKEGWH
jgi:hypothetical protein